MGINERLNTLVSELLGRQIADGRQLGVQVAAYLHGDLVVDVWAGSVGPGDDRPVQRDTLFSSYSTTKGVAATALHILADRGEIAYEAPVAKYWPAFAQNGKGEMTVAQAMSHQGGLHAMPNPLTVEFLCDWDAGIRWIEDATPAWPPGSAMGYHAYSYAWLAGGIVQFATGRHIKEVIQEEIARPLGLEGEMFVGIPDGVETRLASLLTPPPSEDLASLVPDDHPMFQASPRQYPIDFNDMRIRRACIPSANGHFTARVLAKMYGALANGGEVDGVQLVSQERVGLMRQMQVEGPDKVLFGMPFRRGIGYILGGKLGGIHGPMGPRESAFGHDGAGGSIAFADPDVGLSVAVTLNKMHYALPGEGPTFEICELVRTELGLNG